MMRIVVLYGASGAIRVAIMPLGTGIAIPPVSVVRVEWLVA